MTKFVWAAALRSPGAPMLGFRALPAQRPSSGLTIQCDVGVLAAVLPEHEVHEVLRGRQGSEAGPVPDVVQQGSQHWARAAGRPHPRRFLQQLRQVYTGLGRSWTSASLATWTSWPLALPLPLVPPGLQ